MGHRHGRRARMALRRVESPGCNGVKLASPKVYCAASSSDVRAAVNACRALYPNAPVLLAGYSLGTYVIGTYLAEEDSKPGGAAGEGRGGGGVGVVSAGSALVARGAFGSVAARGAAVQRRHRGGAGGTSTNTRLR